MATTSDKEFQHLELLTTPFLQPFCYHWSSLARTHYMTFPSTKRIPYTNLMAEEPPNRGSIPSENHAIDTQLWDDMNQDLKKLRKTTSVEIYRLEWYESLSQVFGLSSILLRRNSSTLLYIRHEHTNSQSRIVATNRNALHGLMSAWIFASCCPSKSALLRAEELEHYSLQIVTTHHRIGSNQEQSANTRVVTAVTARGKDTISETDTEYIERSILPLHHQRGLHSPQQNGHWYLLHPPGRWNPSGRTEAF